MIQAQSAACARAVASGARRASSNAAAWGGGGAARRLAAAQALRGQWLQRRRSSRTVRLHNLQELDHHLRSVAPAPVSGCATGAGARGSGGTARGATHLRHRADQHLLLAALLGVVDALQRVVQHRDPHHPGGTLAPRRESDLEKGCTAATSSPLEIRSLRGAYERRSAQAVAGAGRGVRAHRCRARRRAQALGVAWRWHDTTCAPHSRVPGPRAPLRASAHASACAQRGRRAACGRSRPARRRNGAARAE